MAAATAKPSTSRVTVRRRFGRVGSSVVRCLGVDLGRGGVRVEFERSRRGRVGARLGPHRNHVELLGGIGRVVAVEDVDDHHGDVVASPCLVGLLDEAVGGNLRIGFDRQCGCDVDIVDFVDETVAAQQETVAADQRQRPPVDPNLGLDAECTSDDVAAWMIAGLVLGDVAGGDEFLHVAVVDGDTPESAVTEQVRARVTDVGEHERFARFGRNNRCDVAGIEVVDVRFRTSGVGIGDDGDRGDGGTHALLARSGDRRAEDVAVGNPDRLDDVGGGRRLLSLEQFTDPFDRDLAGDLARFVAPHPVSDDEQPVGDQQVVLVLRSDLAGVGGGPDA